MNWLVLIPVGIGAIALIAFLVWKNRKDEKAFEQQLNNDYRRPKEDEADVETEELPK